ncbi:MAG TPA: ABC transporter substrate-binding protein, partial [Bacillota bacterium]
EQPEAVLTPGAGDPEVQEPIVRVGLITRQDDSQAERGARLALQQRDGQVAGMPVELATLTGPAGLTALAQAVEEMISVRRVHGLVIDLDPERGAVAASVANAAGTPVVHLVGPGAATTPSAFLASPQTVDHGHALARHARSLGAGQAAVLYDVTSLSHRNLARAFAQHFIDLGGAVPVVDAVPGLESGTDAGEVARRLQRAAESHPDTVLLALPPAAAARAVAAASELGLEITFMGGPDWPDAALEAAAAAAGADLVYPVAFYPGREAAETEAFVNAYREAYGEEPSAASARAHDATDMLLTAIESAAASGRFDPQDAATTRRAVIEALKELPDFRGATGLYGAGDDTSMRWSVVLVRLTGDAGGVSVQLAGEVAP